MKALATALTSAALLLMPLPSSRAESEEFSGDLLPRACEVELALSAAPRHLRGDAAVYVLSAEGYTRVREGGNGFTCIVNRGTYPRMLRPTCFDAEGAATIVPKILREGTLMMRGVSPEKIAQEIRSGFEDGTFISPRRPGIAYMISDYNRPYDPGTGTLGWFPPHLMFYAPNLTQADIGNSNGVAAEDRGKVPFIAYAGPHGFMIVPVEEINQPREGDLPDCPDWVRADPPRP